jgi:hypothetical protein
MTSGVVRDRPPLPECLTGDMRPNDLIDALDRLRFKRTDLQTVTIDKATRDYIRDAVRARTRCKTTTV